MLLLNYRDTPKGAKDNPASVWSDDNKKAFLDAVKGGKGLYVYHYASAAFTSPSDINKEFEKAIAGGWRKQGYHGKMHEFTVTVRKEHPITDGHQGVQARPRRTVSELGDAAGQRGAGHGVLGEGQGPEEHRQARAGRLGGELRQGPRLSRTCWATTSRR